MKKNENESFFQRFIKITAIFFGSKFMLDLFSGFF